MFTDMFGNDRLKVGLHMHTTRSDGKKRPRRLLPYTLRRALTQ